MPRRKPVMSLQDLCVRSITINLDRHCLAFRDMCKEGDRRNTCYKFLHRLYSAKMFEMLRDKTIIPDIVCPTSEDCIAFNFQEKTKAPETDYLQFIMNHYTTNLNLCKDYNMTRRRKYYQSKIGEEFPKLGQMIYVPIERRQFLPTDAVLHTISNFAENLSVVELQVSGICSEDLTLLLKSIPQVLDLNVSETCFCDIHMEIVRKTCTRLIKLDISNTSVTDEGVKNLCGDNSSVYEDMCKIANLNIKATNITSIGTRMLLESFPTLEQLQYFDFYAQRPQYDPMLYEVFTRTEDYDSDYPMTHIFGGVVRMFFDIKKCTLSKNDSLSVNKFNLQELYFGIRETEEDILQFALVCFPEVRSVHIAPQIPPQYLSLCTAFSRLTDLTLHLTDIPLLELDELFTVQGSKIEVLSLQLEFTAALDEYMDLFRWFQLCPKLRELFLSGAIFFQECENDAKSFKCLPASLNKIILSGINGSGSPKFLTLMLISATHVQDLSMCFPCLGGDKAVREAFGVHGFKYLRYLELFGKCFSVETLYLLLKNKNLKCLSYPFTNYRRTEDYEKMRNIVKEENLDIDIMDTV